MALSPPILATISVLLSASAQIFLKLGMKHAVAAGFGAENLVSRTALWAVISSPMIFVGLACFGLSVVVWLLVLSTLDVSQAYPFVALGIAITTAGGFLFLGEQVNAVRVVGVVLILGGVFLVARS